MLETKNSFLSFTFQYIDKNIVKINNRAKILDFGCGNGEIVKLARDKGYNVSGCDNFYGGKDDYIFNYDKDLVDLIPESGLLPYSDESFDFIYSNQVFEHINNLETTLSELNRILKKGGQMLHYFPVKECILEGHFGIPFQHRLFNNDKLKKFYLKFFYMLGIGYNRNNSFEEWCMKAIDFVDNYCFYRNKREILSSFQKYWFTYDITFQIINYKLVRKNRNILKKTLSIIPKKIINYISKYKGSILLYCIKK